MSAFDQVIVLLKLLCYVAPVALYFITLGLVNSQSTPRLVSARGDFLALSIALSPLLVAPIPMLWARGLAWVLPISTAAIALGLRFLLPRADSGWVIYNLGVGRGQPLVERALRRLNWAFDTSAGAIRLPDKGFHVTFSALPLLRNTTIHLHWDGAHPDRSALHVLREELTTALARDQQLPSISGCCLLLAGVAMMMLPLWMMSRHGEAVAEVVNQLLLM
ncbi:MAG TPA: hypothetical protein VGM03_24515 [Phycisphaerae bacterium]